jgi:hypothetical protein
MFIAYCRRVMNKNYTEKNCGCAIVVWPAKVIGAYEIESCTYIHTYIHTYIINTGWKLEKIRFSPGGVVAEQHQMLNK